MSAQYRADLEIRLGGAFVNHAASGSWPDELVVNYTAKTPGPGEGAVQVTIYAKVFQEEFDRVIAVRSGQFPLKTSHQIEGAQCWRFGRPDIGNYALWECQYKGHGITIGKQDGSKGKVDEVAMLHTLIPKLGGTALAVQSATPQAVVVLTPDGKAVTINLDEWKGGKLTVEQMELVKQFALKPPSGGAGYTLQAWRYAGVQRNDLPVYEPMRRLDEVMAEGAIGAGTTAVACVQGAASWAKANPAKASLMALSLAVSLAMPYTVAFQASAGGMTFLESAGIGFMTSAAPAAVQTLVTSAASGEGFWKSSGKAALFGGIAGVESLVSTTVGAGVTGTVETGAALTQRLVGARISEQAVKGFGTVASGIAGSATDYGVGILHDQAADAIAQSAAKTTIPDLVPPARSTPAGGIVLPILSKPITRQ